MFLQIKKKTNFDKMRQKKAKFFFFHLIDHVVRQFKWILQANNTHISMTQKGNTVPQHFKAG